MSRSVRNGPRVRRAIGLVLLLAVGIAQAQAPCPGPGEQRIPDDPAALQALDEQLQARQEACGKDARFLSYRGAVLLALGRPADAAPLLELALLLNPDLAVASIDYARALTLLGDGESAAAIWRQLLTRADLPQHLRAEIERRLRSAEVAAPTLPSGWRHQRELSLRAGYDTNLNSAASASELTLTPPDGEISLPIADEAQPKPGGAAYLTGRWLASRGFDGGRELDLRAELRLRGTNVSGTSYRQIDLEAAGRQRWEHGVWSLVVSGADQLFGGLHLFQVARTGLIHSWISRDCTQRAGLEVEWRRYPSSHILDGVYSSASGAVGCRTAGGLWLAGGVRAGVDHPSGERPGGDLMRAELRGDLAVTAFGGIAQATLVQQSEVDRTGYSPLLGNNARRSIRRTTLSLAWARELQPGVAFVVGTELIEQNANLPLFELRGAALQTGLRWLW